MQVAEILNQENQKRGENDLWLKHKRLAQFNHGRLNPQIPNENWQLDLQQSWELQKLEREVLEEERLQIRRLAALAPRDAAEFMAWFEELRDVGPGQNDPLFPWLAHHATRPEMIWFLKQEVAGEAGFDDLTALTQIKMPTRAKLEIARNYWDEMGRGRENGMHGPMLSRLADEVGIKITSLDEIVPESLALANILVGLAMNRQYAFHSLGALGAIELTAPGRADLVYRGLRRLGISAEGQRYYLLHSTLDKKHAAAWNAEVIRPLVEKSPHIAHAIAEGALMRLHAGQRCFERYRQKLWSHSA